MSSASREWLRKLEELQERELADPIEGLCKANHVTMAEFFGRRREPRIIRAQAAYQHWLYTQGLGLAEIARIVGRHRTCVRRQVMAIEASLREERDRASA